MDRTAEVSCRRGGPGECVSLLAIQTFQAFFGYSPIPPRSAQSSPLGLYPSPVVSRYVQAPQPLQAPEG